ncbi:MAG: Gfo/Idh/MocA family oxidoreductase, partial [Armatimonadota bacterium]|nr:Gfo/Idh/MocA family oxidoreductase [Armatimonadota bacterium]
EEKKWVASGWKDVEDWSTLILNFEDGARATISASDIVLGGIRNRMELYLSNGRVDCNLNPNTTCVAYAPSPEVFADEYIAEKLDTKAGWSFPSINEDWFQGYPQEVQDFVECVATGRAPLSDAQLAADVVEVTYAAYQSAREGRRIQLLK